MVYKLEISIDVPFRGLFNMPFGSFAQIGKMGYFFYANPPCHKKDRSERKGDCSNRGEMELDGLLYT